jgi:sugar-specific transcriptional regulator TrmB
MSELEFIKTDINRRKQEIRKRQDEIERQIEQIKKALEPKSKPKEEELSNEDSLRENVPVWISGYLLHGVGSKNRTYELSRDREDNLLKKHLDDAVNYILSLA